MRNTISCN